MFERMDTTACNHDWGTATLLSINNARIVLEQRICKLCGQPRLDRQTQSSSIRLL
jgi:hypothetical protein